MKLDEEGLPPMPEWTSYTDADGPSWSALRVREAMLTAMHAGALAALDEALEICHEFPLRDPARDGNGYWAAANCECWIRRLRDTIMEGK